ncbi:MAG TPA: hypothetical protein VGP69_16495 [Gaiellaceae bacterium]|nr:hypothetical protein [Gaiellaceae bacterium]
MIVVVREHAHDLAIVSEEHAFGRLKTSDTAVAERDTRDADRYPQVSEAKLWERVDGAAEILAQLVDTGQRPVGPTGQLDRKRRGELDVRGVND